MGIFKKRPLAAGLCVMIVFAILGFFLASRVLAPILFLLALAFLFLVVFSALRGATYTKLYLALLVFGALVGLLRTVLYLKPDSEATRVVGNTVTATFEVEEVTYTTSYASSVVVLVTSVNGEPTNEKAVLMLEQASPFRVGDLASGSFRIEDLTYENYYENQKFQLMGKGCLFVLVSEEEQSFAFLGRAYHPVRDWFEKIRFRLSATLSTYVDGEAGALLKAMLLGVREDLSDATVRDFKRAGVSHLLALSGLHVGILVLLMDSILFYVSAPKRLRMSIILLLLLLYLMISGCAVSTVRAVLMIALFYLSQFIRKSRDSITSLFIAAALIVLFHPFAVFSTSYQMTVLATFGILAYGRVHSLIYQRLPIKRRERAPLRKLWRWILSSSLITFAAGFAVLPVQCITFGEMSVITPLSNLALIPLATAFLVVGIFVLFLFPAPLFGFLAKGIGTLMLTLTKLFAIPDTMVSLSYDFVPYVLLPCLALAIVFLLVELKKHVFVAFLPIPLFVVCFFTALFVCYQSSGAVTGVYSLNGRNESIGLVTDGSAMLCDLSSGSTSALQNGWRALREEGATELDVLMLTHYHKAHKTSLSRFSQNETVRALWLPSPRSEEDMEILLSLVEIAWAANIPVTVYDYDKELTVFGSGTLLLTAPLFEKRSVEPALSLTVRFGESSFYYECAALSEYRREKGLEAPVVDADIFVLGAHGPRPHEAVIPCAALGSTVLIPNDEVLLNLEVREDLYYVVYPERYRFLLQ